MIKRLLTLIHTMFQQTQAILINRHYEVLAIKPSCSGHYRQQLLAMGLLPGATFKTQRQAPLGGPVAISINGFLLALRHQEFSHLLLKQVRG